MKVVVVAPCEASWRLAHRLQQQPLHEVAAIYAYERDATWQATGGEDNLSAIIRWHVPPADLNGIDAVIVGAGRWPDRDLQLRELAQTGIPLIVLHPACEALMAFELDMIQRATESILFPFHPDASHPVWGELKQWVDNPDATPLGPVEQIVVERQDEQRTRENVLRLLAQDALLLRLLLGDFDQVGAMGGSGSDNLANLNVHLRSRQGVLCRWSIVPAALRGSRTASGSGGARMTILGTSGQAVLQFSTPGPWTLHYPTGETRSFMEGREETDERNLQIVERVLEGELAAPDWEDACRALDLADTAAESCRRGKTLTIHNQRVTEEDTFKSMMAAGGCLLLTCIPLLLVFISVVEGLQLPMLGGGQGQFSLGPATADRVGELNRARLSDWLLTEFANQGLPLDASARVEVAAAGSEWQIVDARQSFKLRNEGQTLRVYANVRRVWPLLIAIPLVGFLLMQTLKLVFPKPSTVSPR